jgi:hypothetical protein
MATVKDEIVAELERRAKSYNRAGALQEWAFWIGASLSAACSAIAGLSIAANLGAWNEPYGRIISASLAIIPAVWLALDSSVRFRELSIFSYGVSTKLRALSLKMKGQGLDKETRRFIEMYEGIMKDEHEAFSDLLAQETSTKDKAKASQSAVVEVKEAEMGVSK